MSQLSRKKWRSDNLQTSLKILESVLFSSSATSHKIFREKYCEFHFLVAKFKVIGARGHLDRTFLSKVAVFRVKELAKLTYAPSLDASS